MYSEFDGYLLRFSDEREVGDYWHDVGNLYASDLLALFSASDWNALLKDAAQKNDIWIMRFCEVLGEFSSIDVLLVLLSFFDRKDPDVYYMLLEVVRSMAILKGEAASFAKDLLDVIGSVGSGGDALFVEKINDFKIRLIEFRGNDG